MAQEISSASPQNKGLKIIVVFLSLIIILVTGMGIGSFLFSDSFEESPLSNLLSRTDVSETNIPLDEFLVNLTSEGNRSQPVVRAELTLTSTQEDANEVIASDLAKVRDAVIHVISRETTESILADADGEFIIKDKIRNKINETLGTEFVDDVYVTNILLQR